MIEPIVFTLCYESPPLRSNKRLHHMAEHRIKRDIRQAGHVQAQKWMQDNPDRAPLMCLVDVIMTWHVPTKHRRDASSGAPTIKSWIDGVVDAGLLHDDSWVWVRSEQCRIRYAPGEPMKVTVEIQEATDGA